MKNMDVALTIAGSDSGGGAGIQADLKTMEAFGVFGTSAITSITAQNTVGVTAVEDVPPEMVADQIDAVATDFEVKGAKTGMLSNADIIRTVAEKVDEYNFPLVVDPVMVAKSGDRLLREEAEQVLKEELVPKATLVTPNIPEAEVLTDIQPTSESTMESAAKKITQLGADGALVKGGHMEEDEIVDVLYTNHSRKFYKERIETENTHGTGCTLSSAITSEITKGESVVDAVSRAEEFMYRAVKYGLDLGEGHGPVHHMAEIRNDASRFDTLRKVRDAVSRFESADISRLIPEVGTNFALATPYAVSTNDVAAVEGRITRISDGVKANSGVWFGVSSHVARFLLTIRDYDPSITTACNLRLDDRIAEEAREIWDVAEYDRSKEPEDVKEAEESTMGWGASRIMSGRDKAPDAVVDWGEVGKEAILKVLAETPRAACDMVLELNDRLS